MISVMKSLAKGLASSAGKGLKSATKSSSAKKNSGANIISGMTQGLGTGKLFTQTLPESSYFNRTKETGKVRQEYEPFYQEDLTKYNMQRNVGSENLGTNLGARGLSGAGGTAQYQQGMFTTQQDQMKRELDRAKEDAIMQELARRESGALTGYLLKQKDYDTSNYLTMNPVTPQVANNTGWSSTAKNNFGSFIGSSLKNILNK